LVGQPPEFIVAFDHNGQLARAAENVSACALGLSRMAEALKGGVASAKTTTPYTRNRGLLQVTQETVALVDNNIV
jgi:hypothetical protein